MVPQERSIDSRQLVLNTAKRLLWEKADSSLRISDLSFETGLSTTVIYTYFRSRQGLIDTAYLEMYKEMNINFLKSFSEICIKSTSTSDLIEKIDVRFSAFSNEDIDNRSMRLRIAGAAVSRQKMRVQFSQLQEEFFKDLATMFERLQKRKIISTTFSAKELAYITDGLTMMQGILETTSTHGKEAGRPKLLSLIFSA